MSQPSGPARYAMAGQLLYLGARTLPTRHGEMVLHVAQNLATGAHAFALACGDPGGRAPLVARAHSSCVTSETFGGCDCDCVEQLDAALAEIARVGRGVVFYLMQEGRGAGFAAKARDRMIVQASGHRVTTFDAYAQMGLVDDLRRYDEVGFLCRLLDVRAPLLILTNNPEKLDAMREAAGFEIAGTLALSRPPSPYNLQYLSAKSRSGHRLEDPGDGDPAALPERVTCFAPHALEADPRFVVIASYFLPIRPVCAGNGAAEPHWFRLHAYFDLATGGERVVLAHGRRDAERPLVRVQHESILERFPLAGGGAGQGLWHATVRQMVARGAGIAAFVPPVGFDEDLREIPGDPLPAARLIEQHLAGRGAHPVLALDEAQGPTLALFERAGVRALDPFVLPTAGVTDPGPAVARETPPRRRAEPVRGE